MSNANFFKTYFDQVQRYKKTWAIEGLCIHFEAQCLM